MKFHHKKYFLFLIAIVFFTCKKKVENYDLKDSYFPLNVGSWVLYDVDSTVYDPFTSTHYTRHFRIKELISEKFIDNENQDAFVIQRWMQDSIGKSFYIKDIYTAKQNKGNCERVEENQRFVKLVYPPQLNLTWKGNQYITPDLNNSKTKFLGNWDYTIFTLDKAFTLQSNKLDSTITVLQKNETIPRFQSIEYKEIFAKHIGMVYFEHKFLEMQPSDNDWQNGFIVEGIAIDWSNK